MEKGVFFFFFFFFYGPKNQGFSDSIYVEYF